MKKLHVFVIISLLLFTGTASAQIKLEKKTVQLKPQTQLEINKDVMDSAKHSDYYTAPHPYENIKGKYYSLESCASLNNFVCDPLNEKKDKLARVWQVKNSGDSRQATFKIVPGLANSRYFSFESLSSPRHYLRDQGLSAEITKKPDDQNSEYMKSATFKIVPALTGDPFPFVSIESYKRPGKFLYTMQPGDQYDHLTGVGNGTNQEFKKLATFRLETRIITRDLPSSFTLKSKNPENSEWGDVYSEEIQGIAHSDTHWYISNKGTIYKTQKNAIKRVVKKVDLSDIQNWLGFTHCRDYNHFGDMDFYDGLLYVATTGKNAPRWYLMKI
jgi:hypothetical protein